MEEKRSSEQENAQLILDMPGLEQGVGARHAFAHTPQAGGGYLDICTAMNFQIPAAEKKIADPRMKDLEQIGLRRVWLTVAETIGVDAFLAVWQVLDADPSCAGTGSLNVPLPLKSYKTWLRRQRNLYIKALLARGHTPSEVRLKLMEEIGEEVSVRHVQRLMSPGQARGN